MAEKEQVRPLAPASERRPSSDDEETASHVKGHRKKKCIKCSVCIAVFLLILAIIVVILMFTVFRIKDPIIKLNGVTIDKLESVGGTINIPRSGSNMSLTADVSVKNPNYASFKYSKTTTTLFYHATVMGLARGPSGYAKARRTIRMNITVDIIADRLISHPMLIGDMGSGLLPITSFTRVGGRVKLIKLIKRFVVVEMNCSMSVDVASQSIQDQKCKRKVKL